MTPAKRKRRRRSPAFYEAVRDRWVVVEKVSPSLVIHHSGKTEQAARAAAGLRGGSPYPGPPVPPTERSKP